MAPGRLLPPPLPGLHALSSGRPFFVAGGDADVPEEDEDENKDDDEGEEDGGGTGETLRSRFLFALEPPSPPSSSSPPPPPPLPLPLLLLLVPLLVKPSKPATPPEPADPPFLLPLPPPPFPLPLLLSDSMEPTSESDSLASSLPWSLASLAVFRRCVRSSLRCSVFKRFSSSCIHYWP